MNTNTDSSRDQHANKVHLGVIRLQITPATKEKTARTPKTMALAALVTPGLAPPPAPMPFRAPKIPGHVKAVAATMKAAKVVDRYQVTGCLPPSGVRVAILADILVSVSVRGRTAALDGQTEDARLIWRESRFGLLINGQAASQNFAHHSIQGHSLAAPTKGRGVFTGECSSRATLAQYNASRVLKRSVICQQDRSCLKDAECRSDLCLVGISSRAVTQPTRRIGLLAGCSVPATRPLGGSNVPWGSTPTAWEIRGLSLSSTYGIHCRPLLGRYRHSEA